MSILKRLEIRNYIGIREFELEPGKVTVISGPKGSGKSSIIEAIEKLFTNKNRRAEVIRHGEDESMLYAEMDDGLEVSRKVRSDKADYLKCRKGEEGVPSTEKYLRSFINGDIFRPMDWVEKSIEEQTKSILAMLEINWTMDDIQNWFGEIPSNINFSQHILQILKSIELKYYKDREEVNREKNELKTQMDVIRKDMPAGYDGEQWRILKVQEYYSKVAEAQKINQYIEQAKSLRENFESKVKALEADAESEKNRIKLKFRDQRQDIKDIIEISKLKIEKAQITLTTADEKLKQGMAFIDSEMEVKIQEATAKIKADAELYKEKYRKEHAQHKDEAKDTISIQESKISAKNQELISMDALEGQELKAADEKLSAEKEKEVIRAGKATEYLEQHNPIDIKPLQVAADEVANMQSYLRDWDRLIDIRDNKLAPKERLSSTLTSRIEKARELPQELLKDAVMPVDGISVDEKGLIRINGTLIDGLSSGEKWELAMKIAKAQAGDLKVICLDKFDDLNPAEKERVKQEAMNDPVFQYFILSTASDEFKVENLG